MSADKTEYARIIGYKGGRAVIIYDGKVESHNNEDWFEFCQKQRTSLKKQQQKQNEY